MKKKFFLIAVICMAFFGLGLQSCGDEDEEDKIVKENSKDSTKTNSGDNNPLIGTWKMVFVKMIVNGKSQSWDYDNMTYVLMKFDEQEAISTSYINGQPQETTRGKYWLDGNQLLGELELSEMLYEFRGDTLVFQNTVSADYGHVLKLIPYSGKIDVLEETTKPSIDYAKDIIGTWKVTLIMKSGYEDDDKNGLALVPDNKYWTYTFDENGKVTVTFVSQGQKETYTGDYSFAGSVLTLDCGDHGVLTYTIFGLDGDALSLLRTSGSASDLESYERVTN